MINVEKRFLQILSQGQFGYKGVNLILKTKQINRKAIKYKRISISKSILLPYILYKLVHAEELFRMLRSVAKPG